MSNITPNKAATAAISAALASAMLLSSCATYTGQTNAPDDPNRTRTGALIGAGIGAVAGLLSGGDATERRQRAMVGAGVGGLAGAGIGAYQDRQERALRDATANTGISVNRDGDNIVLNLPDGITFDFGKSNLKPQFYPALDGVAATLAQYNQTIVEVVGHTDSVGSDQANQVLSQARAQSVGNYLMGRGLMRERFELEGMGERYPIASNDTDSGRAQNRRVEIRVVPLRG